MNTPVTPQVYAAINAVQSAMSKEGISKDRKNQQQGYAFRGIDDVYAALAPHLAANKLCILPRVIDRVVTEKETKSGGTLFYTALRVEFDFVAVADGSKHTVCTVGEAMDSGDKSSNKAMSAAYKYACFQAFAIPTEGDNDADGHTHEVAARKPAVAKETGKAEPPKEPAKEPTKAFIPMTATTAKQLRFYATSPKTTPFVDKVVTDHGFVGIDDFSEEQAQATIRWIEKKMAAAGEKSV
jgi:hypothetical protein